MSSDHGQYIPASGLATPLPDKIRNPADVYARSGQQSRARQEILRVLLLTDQHRLIGARVVSRGTLSSFITHPREVYRPAILSSAAAIVLVHNHPNGDPTPSEADITLTMQLYEAGRVLGIRLLDHVVVASGGYCSLAAQGAIPEDPTNSEGVHH